MHVRKLSLLLVTVLFTLLASSCWSSRVINELNIALALGIDWIDEEFHVTVQVVNPGETKNPTSETTFTIFKGKGETLFEAVRNTMKTSPRKIYFAHLTMIVFGEDYARQGLSKALDFIDRDHEFRTDGLVVVARETTASELLKIIAPIEELSALKVLQSVENTERSLGESYRIVFMELLNSISSDEKEAVVVGARIKGEVDEGSKNSNIEQTQAPAIIEMANIGVFKDDRLVGWLTEDESLGFNFIMNNVKSTIINTPCEVQGSIVFEVSHSETLIKGTVKEKVPKVNLEVHLRGSIADVSCKVDLTKQDIFNKVEKEIEEEVKKDIEQVLLRAQKQYKSDIFGFGEVIHRTDYVVWNKLKKDWDSHFETLEVEVEVNADVIGTGIKSNPYSIEKKR